MTDVDPIQFEVIHHQDGSTTFDSHLEIHGSPAPAEWKDFTPVTDDENAEYAKTWQGQIDVAAEKFRALGRAILAAFKLR